MRVLRRIGSPGMKMPEIAKAAMIQNTDGRYSLLLFLDLLGQRRACNGFDSLR